MRRGLDYAPLVGLQAARTMRSGAGIGGLLCLGLAALVYGLGSSVSPAAPDTVDAAGAAGHGLLPRGLWELTLLFLVPALALHSAGVIARWRQGESDWLAPRASRSGALLATAVGLSLGVALLASLPALAVAGVSVMRGTQQADRCLLVHALGNPARVQAGHTLQFALGAAELPNATRLRLRVVPASGGGRVREVRLVLVRGEQVRETSLVLQGRTWIEAELPQGTGKLAIGLHNAGEGAVLVPGEDSAQVFGREGSSLSRGMDLWLRAWRALTVLAVLALGLGAWMSPGPAAGCAVILPLVLESRLGTSAWLPWSDLRPALELLGEGRLEQVVGAGPWLSTSLWMLAGLLLGRFGLNSWSTNA